jgi:hypothetical protein
MRLPVLSTHRKRTDMTENMDTAGNRKKARHRQEKPKKVKGKAPDVDGLTLQQPRGIAPGWVLAYMFCKEFCANIPWDEGWNRTWDAVDKISDFLM